MAAPTIITLWFPERTRGVMLGMWCTWVPLSIALDSIVCPALVPMSVAMLACALFIRPGKDSEYQQVRKDGTAE